MYIYVTNIFNYKDAFGTNHGAEEMRLALSVLQLRWVKSGRCLYAPLAVNRCAYAHITVVAMSRANRSSIGSCLV